jgi:hypothetical protein
MPRMRMDLSVPSVVIEDRLSFASLRTLREEKIDDRNSVNSVPPPCSQ